MLCRCKVIPLKYGSFVSAAVQISVRHNLFVLIPTDLIFYMVAVFIIYFLLFSLYVCFHILNVLFACVFSNTDTVSWLVGVHIKVML